MTRNKQIDTRTANNSQATPSPNSRRMTPPSFRFSYSHQRRLAMLLRWRTVSVATDTIQRNLPVMPRLLPLIHQVNTLDMQLTSTRCGTQIQRQNLAMLERCKSKLQGHSCASRRWLTLTHLLQLLRLVANSIGRISTYLRMHVSLAVPKMSDVYVCELWRLELAMHMVPASAHAPAS